MPIETIHFLLEAFLDGDFYSARADKRRFSTIDNQIYRIAEIINDGVIDGWDVTDSFPSITISPGSGLIDKYYVNSFNNISFELIQNSTYYLYAQRRIGIIGILGPRSDLSFVEYIDSGAPDVVSDFEATENLFDSVTLEWTANSEVDLDYYRIQRSVDGSDYSTIYEDDDTTFTDETVDEDVSYYYRIYAVDQSGFESDSSIISVTTPLNTALPPNPISVVTKPSENAINILWDRPPIPFNLVSYWQLVIHELNSDNTIISDTQQTFTIDRSLYNYRVDDLNNNIVYRLTLQTVDTKGRVSEGFVRDIQPQTRTSAPRDPQSINYDLDRFSNGIRINISWENGDSPYDESSTDRYRAYIQIDGEQESEGKDLFPGDLDASFFLDGNLNHIPGNKLITCRVTSVADCYHTNPSCESLGNYVRFTTSSLNVPYPVQNLSALFDIDTRNINISWDINSDVYDIRIQIFATDLDDEYLESTLVLDEQLGRVDRYSYQNANLNYSYSIIITPFNYDGEAGTDATTSVITTLLTSLLPEPPQFVFSDIGDKEILISWSNSPSQFVRFYNIYRMTGEVELDYEQWTLIDTVSRNIFKYIDYGLTNDTTYSYYVTSVDVYGRESLHLPDEIYNLNFVEATPARQGILTEPTNVDISLSGNEINLSWDFLNEEFDSFYIYRSIGDLHSWTFIDVVDKNVTTYTDVLDRLVDQTNYYYLIQKVVNDADLKLQTTNIQPENSIFLAKIVVGDDSITVNTTGRRVIADLEDPIAEYANQYLLPHRHLEKNTNDASRIDLNPELIITDWTTVDGKIFTTREPDISGNSYIVKVNGRFPSVFYSINQIKRQIVFVEPIVTLDENGLIIGDIPEIEVRVLGVSETQGILDASRFDNLHARQIQFGVLNTEQLPQINHEGRIGEQLFPKRFLLERYNNYSFIVPQHSQDSTKNFGNGTTFYAVSEYDGDIYSVINFDSFSTGSQVGFRSPLFDTDTLANLDDNSDDVAEVDDSVAFQGSKSYHFQFKFADYSPYRWVKLTSYNTANQPNPVIDLSKKIKFRVLLTSGSVYLTLGVREISGTSYSVGDDGGTEGTVKWVGASSFVINTYGTRVLSDRAPIGVLVEASDEWQTVEIDIPHANVLATTFGPNPSNVLSRAFGTFEHLAVTINPSSSTRDISLYIDKIDQFSDIMAAGTSNGLLFSKDFGTTWLTSRLTDTPVHKFYTTINNDYLWAISSTQVLLSVDPLFWFVTSGTTGIQSIHDIISDSYGNMYISTDKGVYFLDVSSLSKSATFKQCQPVNAFTSDCYALYCNPIASGIDEIWVSTEIGIYKTTDNGNSWQDANMDTGGLIAYQMYDIGSSTVIAINRKHVLRKMENEYNFSVIANMEDQFGIFDIWTSVYFNSKIYLSTGSGIFVNVNNDLFSSGSTITFEKALYGLTKNNNQLVSFCLNPINISGNIRLFIGQENKLLSYDVSEGLKVKTEYRKKELPSFFVNDSEYNIGYTYNSFNNVICFREPLLANSIVSAAHLPRQIFIAANGGWSQTNPESDVFIYKNGLPTWLDFRLDNTKILDEMTSIESKLNGITDLNDFNSLYPQSQQLLQKTIESINTIQSGPTGATGATGSTFLINRTSIVNFIDNYSRFVSAVSSEVVQDAELTQPIIYLSGFSRDERQDNSKAEIFEQKNNFESHDSSFIIIDSMSGSFSFKNAFDRSTNIEDKALYSFSKYDHLSVDIFKCNISSTGEFTHPELEDYMENVNTGLSSNLSSIAHANLIKMGIYLERMHNNMFDIYDVQNIQSRFYSSYETDWYDKINSTIDYSPIVLISNESECRFSNDVEVFLSEDPYFVHRVWIASDVNISDFDIETNGSMSFNGFIVPGGSGDLFVWDIYPYSDTIYTVCEDSEQRAYLFLTSDFGSIWSEVPTINLPDQIYKLVILNGNKIVCTEEGMFYCDNDFGTWFEPIMQMSDAFPSASSGSLSQTAFKKRIINIYSNTFLIVESDGWFYRSRDGVEFLCVGNLLDSDMYVNVLYRFKNLTWIGTNKGLYNDNNSILSDRVGFGLQYLEESEDDSTSIHINDITNDDDAIYCATSTGLIYRFFADSGDNEWLSYRIADFDTIHKIKMYEYGDSKYILAISYDQMKAIDVTQGSGVFG